MRLTLTDKDIQDIIDSLVKSQNNRDLIKKIELQIKKPISLKKRNATKKATHIRVTEAKKKVENAINLLRFENQKINVNSVSRQANISYNTAKKYKAFIERQK
jgi:beta-phosphoglucomutase-like phosphatase (HAD superfamily)